MVENLIFILLADFNFHLDGNKGVFRYHRPSGIIFSFPYGKKKKANANGDVIMIGVSRLATLLGMY